MSETLGQKLRQAREERGISISEVAEQTRISPLYLESIENDDYRGLPGGIFNKGFVKSFAKYVGIDEQEALLDYSRLINQSSASDEPELKVYRPEVLTDGHSRASGIGTIVVAVIILAAMTGGVLFLVNYIRRPSEPVATSSPTPAPNAGDAVPGEKPASDAPVISAAKFELSATNKTTVFTTLDAETAKKNDIPPGTPVVLEPREKVTISYLRWNAPNLSLTINGKAITLPAVPLTDPKGQRVEFTIDKDNLAAIWTRGSVVEETQPAASETTPSTGTAPAANTANTETNTNTAAPAATPAPPRPTPTPRPASTTAANTAANTATPTRPAANARPAATPQRPPATPRPTPNQ